jgi:hypothetical protein
VDKLHCRLFVWILESRLCLSVCFSLKMVGISKKHIPLIWIAFPLLCTPKPLRENLLSFIEILSFVVFPLALNE